MCLPPTNDIPHRGKHNLALKQELESSIQTPRPVDSNMSPFPLEAQQSYSVMGSQASSITRVTEAAALGADLQWAMKK